MGHLEIFYFLITYFIGLVSLGVTGFLYFNTKNSRIPPFILFFSAFSLLNGLNFITSYQRTNVNEYQSYFHLTLLYLENPLLFTTLIFLTPYFVLSLIDLPNKRQLNQLFAGLAIMAFLVHNGLIWVHSYVHFYFSIAVFKNSIFLGTLLFCWITLILKFRKVQSQEQKMLRFFTISLGVFFVGILNDIFFLSKTNFKTFPLIFASVGLFFAIFYYKTLKNTLQINPTHPLSFDYTELENRFGLSAREVDVVRLLVEGKSYKEIGETLYISLNTVKTHARNIYSKLNVSSRHAIIKFLSNTAK